MVNVSGIQGPKGPQAIEATGAVSRKSPIRRPHQVTDTVEISTAAKLAMKVREIPDVRAELVARVKEQIAVGTYETPERIEAAADRLLTELFPNL